MSTKFDKTIVSTAHVVAGASGESMIQSLVVWFFIGNEGLSVIENASNAGVPIPAKLKSTLEKFKDRK